MSHVALVTVHGMGETPPTYAEGVMARLRGRLGALAGQVTMRSVYYQKILQDNQNAIWAHTNAQATLRYPELRKFVLHGFGDAAGLENRKELPGSVYELAQGEIARTLLSAHAVHPGMPVVFLAQSLGCQVLSSYIYDAQKAAQGRPVGAGIWRNIGAWAITTLGRPLTASEQRFIGAGSCAVLVTTGCNIPVFVAAHLRMHIIPIARPTPGFRWINFYDPDDVLGWPLQPLPGGYRELVEDRVVNAGSGVAGLLLRSWNPLAHDGYWEDAAVLDTVAALLRGLSRPAPA
ncbi:hypothetical protein [Massilia sp. MS-15]|uniref:hypothetical protein n=1 Tax=Massilia sp. MS-15 TaxID=2878200 RepID=UPI001CD24C24|nr:hypothetical protein [Massilia sp. MS-15]MCA1248598.1 hypothetical protein [Massilia sp. MS-15]